MASATSAFDNSREDLVRTFQMKYPDLATAGWGPRMRWRFGYFTPDDHYETLLRRVVEPGCTWLDVGCGRRILPSNPTLARMLADRAARLVGVDPDPTLDDNPYVHDRVRQPIENFDTADRFDLVTMRMVAEHVRDPKRLIETVHRLLKSGGLLVVYTVNGASPVPVLTRLVPFRLHYVFKRILWGTEARDTFPTAFRMNSRRRLRHLMARGRFTEVSFAHLDDCRALAGWRLGQWLELGVWRACHAIGMTYPENCLLGVYRRS